MKEATVRLSRVVSREFVMPIEDIPPELVEKMGKAIADRMEQNLTALISGPTQPPPRRPRYWPVGGIVIHNFS